MKEKKFNILSIDCDWVRCMRTQQDLISFLIPLIFKNSNIIMDYDHDKIYSHFAHGYDEYNLFNVDHHHDYGYDDHKNLYEGNWLYHLSNVFYKKINYIWINNPNSEHPDSKNRRKMQERLKSYSFDQNVNYIPEQKFDKIFICCSSEFEYNTHIGISTYKIIERIINHDKPKS